MSALCYVAMDLMHVTSHPPTRDLPAAAIGRRLKNHQIDSMGSDDPKKGQVMDFRSPQARANDKPSYGSPYPPQPIDGKSGERNKKRKTPSQGTRENIAEDLLFGFLIRE
ncbi:hypothetical protein AVEN_106379-1 [Araneus ventricosus]|uniref:Uncharacterized protein n=1 Tax=Araneus ventricosus TaxID=182803 RepID=A0A4Y2ASS0_ARAVE|nr:hypothetical protein AVEN_106379-1 [Araneus ventricosus]